MVLQNVLSLTQKEEPLANIFVLATPTSYKTRKTNLDFCFNFYASEAHTKVFEKSEI